MFDLNNIVRKNILKLSPYSSARDEFKGKGSIFLDANENPFGHLNRYPDPRQKVLKEKLSAVKNIPAENIFIGNGSDEAIDLLFRIFCEPGKDKALTFGPTYGMYQVSADINDVELIQIPLNDQFDLDESSIENISNIENLKLIFLCSPNNPTGNCFNKNYILKILKTFKGIVVIDEAYADFSDASSWKEQINTFPNLIVLQTMSKAWGLAAARVGMAFATTEILAFFNKVKPPYNVSQPNQDAAIAALSNFDFYNKNIRILKKEKVLLKEKLEALLQVIQVFPSEANFFLVKMEDAPGIYQTLCQIGIITRNRSQLVHNCLRVSIGTPEENKELINTLKNIKTISI